MDLPKKFCDEMKRILGEEYPAYLASIQPRSPWKIF